MNSFKIAQKESGAYDSLLSHEVRNPLTNIDLALEFLLAGVKDNEHKVHMEIIMRSSMRINQLMNALIKCQQANKTRCSQ
jgi:signal transduction histidine kinase